MALSQDSADGYVKSLRRMASSSTTRARSLTRRPFPGTTIGVPFTRLAKEETGRAQTTNVLALGAVVGITGIVSVESIRKAVIEAVPAGTGR